MEPRALKRGATSAGASWPWSGNTKLGPSTMVIGGVTTTHRVNRIPMFFFLDHKTINPNQVLPVTWLALFFFLSESDCDFRLFFWCGTGERD